MRIKLHVPMSVSEISSVIGGICCVSAQDTMIEYITTDTRELFYGDLFIAIKGERYNGEDYVDAAISKGAIPISKYTKGETITVSDTTLTLLKLAKYYKTKKLQYLRHTVAITGSVGKTTVKNILSVLLSEQFITHTTVGNYNNLVGVPLTILSAPRNCEAMILEMGMNHLKEIEALSLCALPTLAIITNIGTSHIGNLGSKELIAKAKCEITAGMTNGYVLCPHEEALLSHLENRISISKEQKDADFLIKPLCCKAECCAFDLLYSNKALLSLKASLGAEHLMMSLGMASAAAYLIGVDEANIRKGLAKLSSEHTRYKIYDLNNFTIYDDSYNASVESIVAAFEHLKLFHRPFSALLGDILELGSKTEEIHKAVGAAAFNAGIEKLYLFGSYSHFIAEGAKGAGMEKEKIFINTDVTNPSITAKQIIDNHISGEMILLKASNKLRLSRVAEILKERSEKED